MTYKTSTPLRLCLAYSAPVTTTVWLITPMGIVQGIYAKYYGISLASIAAIIFIARLFDAISDPLIGYYADRYYQRTGTHKPFILIGGLLFIASSYFLYVPPAQVNITYLLVCFLAIYLAWTLFEIPHLAWANVLAQTSQDKSFIFSCRNIAGYAGMLLFFTIPQLPFFESSAITPETLQVSVIFAGVLMFILLFYCLKATPGGFYGLPTEQQYKISSTVKKGVLPPKGNFQSTVGFVLGNKPLLLFISAYLLINTGSSMWYSLIFIYVDAYLGLGQQFAQMFMLAFMVGILVTPFWYKLTVWLNKKYALIISSLLLGASFFYTTTLTPLNTSFSELIALKIVQTLGFSGLGMVAPALLGEIVDYSTWKTGSDRAALYFSYYAFTLKASGALGVALGLGVASWYGVDVAAISQTTSSIWGLALAMTWIPLMFSLIAALLFTLSPINTRRHAIIQCRLNTRAKR